MRWRRRDSPPAVNQRPPLFRRFVLVSATQLSMTPDANSRARVPTTPGTSVGTFPGMQYAEMRQVEIGPNLVRYVEKSMGIAGTTRFYVLLKCQRSRLILPN